MPQWESDYSGHSKTYVVLNHTAWHLLDTAETHEKGSLLNLQAAAVFCAFALEAYLNHVGEEELEFWSEIDRISYAAKLEVLAKHLGFTVDKSQRPFQTILELFRFRNELAHGRTQTIQETIVSSSAPDTNAAWRLLPHEQLTTEAVRRYYEDVRKAIEFINSNRTRKDKSLWNQGGRTYSTWRSDRGEGGGVDAPDTRSY